MENAVLCALAEASTAASPIPNFKPMFAVIMLSGIAFGPEAGFLVGAISAFASNFFYGQGAYTPWQMFAYGAGGMLAGFVFRKKWLPREPLAMGIFGYLVVLLFIGPILDTCSVFLTLPEISLKSAWPLYISGFPVNLSQGACTFLTMLLFGRPLLEKLDRVKTQYGMMEEENGLCALPSGGEFSLFCRCHCGYGAVSASVVSGNLFLLRRGLQCSAKRKESGSF